HEGPPSEAVTIPEDGRGGKGAAFPVASLKALKAECGEELVERLGELAHEASAAPTPGAVEQIGDRAEQVAEEISGTLLGGNIEHDLVEVDHQAEEIEVERTEDEIENLARLRRGRADGGGRCIGCLHPGVALGTTSGTVGSEATSMPTASTPPVVLLSNRVMENVPVIGTGDCPVGVAVPVTGMARLLLPGCARAGVAGSTALVITRHAASVRDNNLNIWS